MAFIDESLIFISLEFLVLTFFVLSYSQEEAVLEIQKSPNGGEPGAKWQPCFSIKYFLFSYRYGLVCSLTLILKLVCVSLNLSEHNHTFGTII